MTTVKTVSTFGSIVKLIFAAVVILAAILLINLHMDAIASYGVTTASVVWIVLAVLVIFIQVAMSVYIAVALAKKRKK